MGASEKVAVPPAAGAAAAAPAALSEPLQLLKLVSCLTQRDGLDDDSEGNWIQSREKRLSGFYRHSQDFTGNCRLVMIAYTLYDFVS